MGRDRKIVPKPYPNIPPLFGLLVSLGVCSLNELRTIYTFEDAVWMYEAVMVPKYNEWREIEAGSKKGVKR